MNDLTAACLTFPCGYFLGVSPHFAIILILVYTLKNKYCLRISSCQTVLLKDEFSQEFEYFLQKNSPRGTAKIFRWGGVERSQFIEFLRTLHGFFYIAALNDSPLYPLCLPPPSPLPPMVLPPMRKISFQRALKLHFNVMALLSNLYCCCHFLFKVCS